MLAVSSSGHFVTLPAVPVVPDGCSEVACCRRTASAGGGVPVFNDFHGSHRGSSGSKCSNQERASTDTGTGTGRIAIVTTCATTARCDRCRVPITPGTWKDSSDRSAANAERSIGHDYGHSCNGAVFGYSGNGRHDEIAVLRDLAVFVDAAHDSRRIVSSEYCARIHDGGWRVFGAADAAVAVETMPSILCPFQASVGHCGTRVKAERGPGFRADCRDTAIQARHVAVPSDLRSDARMFHGHAFGSTTGRVERRYTPMVHHRWGRGKNRGGGIDHGRNAGACCGRCRVCFYTMRARCIAVDGHVDKARLGKQRPPTRRTLCSPWS